MKHRVLVLIPCWNEGPRIGAIVTSAHGAVPLADIVVVNDGSTDNSAREAVSAGAMVLSHAVNLGYGAALETGYIFASRNNYDIVLQMDGDGQHSGSELTALMKSLDDDSADIVIGSRYRGSTDTRTIPLLRRVGHTLFRIALMPLTGGKLTDPTSGLRGLNRRALKFLTSGVFPCDYPDADVILMLTLSGLRIAEVSVAVKPSPTGKSMHSGFKPLYYGMKMSLSMFIVLLNHRKWRRWRKSHAIDSTKGDS